MVVLNLNNKNLMLAILGSSIVYGAVVMKNSSEQMEMAPDNIVEQIGMGLFALGWMVVAYVISNKKMGLHSLMSILGSMGILIAVMNMKAIMKEKKMMDMEMDAKEMNNEQREEFKQLRIPGLPMEVFMGMFVVSWILVGISVGMGRPMLSKILGAGATGLVLSTMMVILPKQRELCVVDGPGMGLFLLAWVLLSIGSSLK